MDEATVRQEMALHDAQFVVAREQGFASWTKLKIYAEASPHARHTRLFVADMQWITERVQGLLRTRQSAGPAALEQIREWHPRFSGCSDEEIRQAPFTEADARLVYAREHGFDSWDELVRRVNLLASDCGRRATEPFLAAFRALQAGDVAALCALLRRNPRLAKERGTNGNTLLNLAVSIAAKASRCGTGDGRRHCSPPARMSNDPNDRGWTPLHQAAYSNQCAMAAALIRSGADLDAEAHGSGGTPLIAALFWGHREVADLLGRHSAAPGNLRVAAGLGNPRTVGAVLHADEAHADVRSLRGAGILPAAQRIPGLAAIGRSAGGPGRGSGLGLEERPHRGPPRSFGRARAWMRIPIGARRSSGPPSATASKRPSG